MIRSRPESAFQRYGIWINNDFWDPAGALRGSAPGPVRLIMWRSSLLQLFLPPSLPSRQLSEDPLYIAQASGRRLRLTTTSTFDLALHQEASSPTPRTETAPGRVQGVNLTPSAVPPAPSAICTRQGAAPPHHTPTRTGCFYPYHTTGSLLLINPACAAETDQFDILMDGHNK
jgi:hypothetical protein